MSRALLSIGVAGIVLASFAFEKIALIDSLDEAQKWDVETPEGTLKVLEDALRPHSTRVLWRGKSGADLGLPFWGGPLIEEVGQRSATNRTESPQLTERNRLN